MADFEEGKELSGKVDRDKYLRLCNQGLTIVATKAYQDDTGCSISEAWDYIKSLTDTTGKSKG